ncbi:MAG: hypothetical protein HKN76_09890 [Saprospiraceae bacterium]|nr:hypothetical protein [Saprospiraceae bacterium]
MNIVLFTNRDFEANLAFNLLKKELLNHRVKIYFSENVGAPKNKPWDLRLIEYYEKEFIFRDLNKIIKDNRIDTTFEFFNEDFKSFSLTRCTNPNTPGFISEVSRFAPDLFISIRFAKIFRDEIISVPKKGILNLHSAILPDYRGIMGTLHNLKDDKKEYGCTLHYITSRGIDTGEIVAMAKRKINKKRSLLWHIFTLYPPGCELIIDGLQKLTDQDRLPVRPQNATLGNYFSVPTEEDFQRLKRLGFETFNENDYIEILSDVVSPSLRDHLTNNLGGPNGSR